MGWGLNVMRSKWAVAWDRSLILKQQRTTTISTKRFRHWDNNIVDDYGFHVCCLQSGLFHWGFFFPPTQPAIVHPALFQHCIYITLIARQLLGDLFHFLALYILFIIRSHTLSFDSSPGLLPYNDEPRELWWLFRSKTNRCKQSRCVHQFTYSTRGFDVNPCHRA